MVRIGSCLALMLVISAFHFGTDSGHAELHNLYEHLYYVPILLVAFWYGPFLGVGFALITSLIYLVHVLTDLAGYSLLDPALHLLLYNSMALLVGSLSAVAQSHVRHLRKASTELSEAYDQLRVSSQRLERSRRLAALGRLSAGIAHEIRNPLGSIRGAVDILTADVPPDSEKQEFVAIVKQEVQRINTLIERFLRFAHPPEPQPRQLAVGELVRSAINPVATYAGRRGVSISCRCGDETVCADENQLRQVLIDAFLNSIEAMPRGGSILVEAREDSALKHTVLEVSDTGEGVSDADLERMFDPFYTTKPQGAGLGLAICHQLVQNQGGEVVARRNQDGGLTLTFFLPSGVPEPVAAG